MIFGEYPPGNMSKIWPKTAKNGKSAEISPSWLDKIQKKTFFQKISSRVSRYHLKEDPEQFIAFIHNYHFAQKIANSFKFPLLHLTPRNRQPPKIHHF